MDQTLSESIPELIVENGVKVGNFSICHHGVEEMATMGDLKNNSELCDVCLLTESSNTKILAHRLVLSASSKYFRSIFKTKSEGIKFVFPFKDVSSIVLSQIVDFVYTGKIKLTEEDVEEYLKWSIKYELPKLTSLCENFFILSLNMSNLMKYKEIASIYGCFALIKELDEHIDENFMNFQQTTILQETSAKDLKEILLRDSLCCGSEEDVFNAVVNWYESNPKEREQQLMQLLPCIRFPLLSPAFILSRANAFNESKDALIYCFKATQWHHLSKKEKQLNKEFCATARAFTQPSKTTCIPKKQQESAKIVGIPAKQQQPAEPPCTPIKEQGQTIALQSLAYFLNRFWTYDISVGAWKTIHTLNVSGAYVISSKDANQVLFKSPHVGKYILVNLAKFPKERKILGPTCNSEELFESATCIVGSEIYFIGGHFQNVTTNEGYVLNLNTNEMRCIAPMKMPRQYFNAFFHNNCIYVMGGWNEEKGTLREVEKYDVKTGKWSNIASLRHARIKCHCVVYKNKMYVFGNASDVAERYDFGKNEWSEVFTRLPCRDLECAVVIGDDFFIISQNHRSYRFDQGKKAWIKLARLMQFAEKM